MAGHFAGGAGLAVATQPNEVGCGGRSGYEGMDVASPRDGSSTTETATTHADYDLLPYPSMPIVHTQPAHLAALGALFGLAPPAADRARVLEFGCAAGGNIIPLAARFPAASFLGIDLSQRHVADGRNYIAALGLDNVRLQQADLTTLDLGGEQFDYIICHGVFSWVPKAAQDAIFRLCQEALMPNGIATISYNVLPGWHLRTAIRELCLRYAGKDGSPQRRVARARAALEQIAAASNQTEPYGMLLQTEARRLKGVPAAYILGEFLAPDNAPCYVQDFIERAAAHKLDYLCEADLFAAVPPALDATIRNRITAFADSNRSAAEQDIDFLTGRLFRRSVLVRSRPAGAPPPMPNPNRLQALHVSCPLRPDAANSAEGTTVFTDDKSRPVSIRDPVVGQAISRLAAVYPGTLCLDDLIRDSDPAARVQLAERIRQAVFILVMAGRADISVLPLRVGQGDEKWPTAWPLARAEAASRQAWITSLRHTGVPAVAVLKVLLPCLDGSRDHLALVAILIDALRSGAVPMPEATDRRDGVSADSVEIIADRFLRQTLEYLHHHALLLPDARPPNGHSKVSDLDGKILM
jgi:methyltransferase-like protein